MPYFLQKGVVMKPATVDEFGSEFVQDEKTGMWVRQGTYDLEMLKYKQKLHYSHIPKRKGAYLEIGGCCGFATHQLCKLSKRVVSVEPVFSSYHLVKLNAPTADVRHGLVTTGPSGQDVEVMLSNEKNFGTASNLITRGRELSVMTKTINFKDLLKEVKPTVIYMDCEGAEYSLLTDGLPKFVKAIFLELHLNKKIWRSNAKILKSWLEDQGFNCVHQPKLAGKHWSTVGTWER